MFSTLWKEMLLVSIRFVCVSNSARAKTYAFKFKRWRSTCISSVTPSSRHEHVVVYILSWYGVELFYTNFYLIENTWGKKTPAMFLCRFISCNCNFNYCFRLLFCIFHQNPIEIYLQTFCWSQKNHPITMN